MFAAKRIDFYLLNTKAVEEVYPAMNINAALVDKDSLRLKFFKDVLEMCQFVRVLHIDVINYDSTLYDKVYGVLGLMGCNLLHKPTHFSNRKLCQIPLMHRNVTSISIHGTETETFKKYLNILLPKYNLLKRNPQVYAEVNCRVDCDLSTLITMHIKQLHLLGSYSHCRVTLLMAGKLSNELTHLILKECHIDDSVPSTFVKAVENGDLPHLKRIELVDCEVSDSDWPEVPEFSFKTWKELDLIQLQNVLSKLTELTVHKLSDINIFIPLPLENITICKLEDIDSCNVEEINNIFGKGKMPNLSEMYLSADLQSPDKIALDSFLDGFNLHKTVKLEKLALARFIISAEQLKILSEKLAAVQLTELDLSWCSGFTDNLSVLFTHSFPTLNTLILSWCELNAKDLQSLARANLEGKLPQLRHLDISGPQEFEISDLFTRLVQWNHWTILETSDINVLNVEPQCLTSLEKLTLLGPQSEHPSVTRQWPHLKIIEVYHGTITSCIADGVERGMFPSLTTLRWLLSDYGKPFFKLLKANISVEGI